MCNIVIQIALFSISYVLGISRPSKNNIIEESAGGGDENFKFDKVELPNPAEGDESLNPCTSLGFVNDFLAIPRM